MKMENDKAIARLRSTGRSPKSASVSPPRRSFEAHCVPVWEEGWDEGIVVLVLV